MVGWCVDRHSFLTPLSTVVATPPQAVPRCRTPSRQIGANLTTARSASRMTRASQSSLVRVDPADAIRFAPLLDLDCVTQRLDRLRIRHTLDVRVCPLRIAGLWLRLVCHVITSVRGLAPQARATRSARPPGWVVSPLTSLLESSSP